jgi:apolipoprotein N-acyltransferase
MTNDGWWDDTPGYKQHMAYARLRAIEFRKPVVRSANSGISCFIDRRGEVSQATQYGIPAAIVSKVQFSDEQTFFSRYGDLVGAFCRLFALILLTMTLILWIKKSWLEKL